MNTALALTMTVTRRLRHIIDAIPTHGYTVDMYVEYEDGRVEYVRTIVISRTETSVRLTEEGSNWEENIGPSCPGWFRCDPPVF